MSDVFEENDNATVVMTEEAVDRTVEIWQAALREITATLREAESTLGDGYTVDVLSQIRSEIKAIIGESVSKMREELSDDMDRMIDEIEGTFSGWLDGQGRISDFATVSTELVDTIAQQIEISADQVGEKATSIGTRLSDDLRRVQLESLAISEITSESIEERKVRLIQEIKSKRLELPEGWSGTIDSYAEMVARTTMSEAARVTTLEQADKYGIDTFQVSMHGAIDSCGPFEGRLVGKTGKEPGVSMSVSDIYGMSPLIFHPNCRHKLIPYDDGFSSDDRIKTAKKAMSTRLPSIEELKQINNDAAKLKREQEKRKEPIVRDEERKNREEKEG